ncbi:ATP-binding protein [Sphingomonas sp. RB3P16]|uniref:sensor histidine kinase n=1 Tax=Parasphingomonas frigoris TaxID=3096163 RepID=UPI002FC5E4C7
MSDRAGYQSQSGHLRRKHGAAGHAAHDLCNQLQVVESALNVIRRSIQGDTATRLDEVFGYAILAVERASRLSRAIVDTKTHREVTERLVSIAEQLAMLSGPALLSAGSNIVIEHRVAEDVPDVYCDPDALDDAILNIIVNAKRAMPSGGLIRISATRDAQTLHDLPWAVLRIVDSGCGMSPEIAARAFEPRFTTGAPGQSSGLGLAMVAEFAREAGGSAELQSRVGAGTVVTIRLPGAIKQVRHRCGPLT